MSYGYGSRSGASVVRGGDIAGGGREAGPGKQTLVQQAYAEAPARASSASTADSAMAAGGDRAGECEEPIGGEDAERPSRSTSTDGGVLSGGDASSISTGELAAPDWKPHGQFKWWIRWTTNGTRGWIVQRIVNTYSGTDGSGTAISNASLGVVPSYYEAWAVDASGAITGSLGATGNRDRWERPSLGNGSRGSWSMTGTVYWTHADPAASGFTSGGVTNAGSLLSSTSAPAGLSAVLTTRRANGTWNSTSATPTHTGTTT